MKPDKGQHHKAQRRVYPEELKKEAVQMLLDGHSAASIAQNLGIGQTSQLYRWPRSSAKRAERLPHWGSEYGSSKINSAAPSGSATS
jgi:transposase-like protein